MQPHGKKNDIKELEPIKDKILGCVSGNHEKEVRYYRYIPNV